MNMKYWWNTEIQKCHFDHHADYAGHDLDANVRQYKLLKLLHNGNYILNSEFVFVEYTVSRYEVKSDNT
jgi:hypothetical protein